MTDDMADRPQATEWRRLETDESALIGTDVNATQAKARKGTVPASVFNLTNTIIGGGMLSLPFAFKSSGLLLGVFLLVGMYALGIYSLHCVWVAGQQSPSNTYEGIAEFTFGNKGKVLTAILIFLMTFPAVVGYMIIVGDMISPLLAAKYGVDAVIADRRLIMFFGLIIVLPLVMLKQLNSLRHTSLLSCVCILYLFVIILVRCGEQAHREGIRHGSLILVDWKNFFLSLPLIAFAFTAHFNLPAVELELQNPTSKRIHTVINLSMLVCLVIYGGVGISGYLTFYDKVDGNVLLSYDSHDGLVGAARVGIAVVVILSMPLMVHPARAAMEQLFFKEKPFSRPRLWAEGIGITLVAFTIACITNDISAVFGITGAMVSTVVCYILPATFVLRVTPGGLKDRSKWAAWALLIIGIFLFFACTIVTLESIIRGKDKTEEIN